MQIGNWSFFVNTIFPIGQTQAKRKGCDLMRLAITTKLLPAKNNHQTWFQHTIKYYFILILNITLLLLENRRFTPSRHKYNIQIAHHLTAPTRTPTR